MNTKLKHKLKYAHLSALALTQNIRELQLSIPKEDKEDMHCLIDQEIDILVSLLKDIQQIENAS